MSRWLYKALIQGGISLLPGRDNLNYAFQRYATKSVLPTRANMARHLEWCSNHVSFFQRFRQRLATSVIELGTGWEPTVPVGLYLCGIDEIYSIDIHDLKKRDIQQRMLDVFYSLSLEEMREMLPQVQEQRFEKLLSTKGEAPEKVFDRLNIRFLITDARKTAFPDATFDFFVSNTTLEHIPQQIIIGIFQEFQRLATADALMSHTIDMNDHYSHFDRSITGYHFLQHNDLIWRIVNNALQYQNRLRVSEYRGIHSQTGFEIVYEYSRTDNKKNLEGLHLAKKFMPYSYEDLATTSSWIVSQPRKKS